MQRMKNLSHTLKYLYHFPSDMTFCR